MKRILFIFWISILAFSCNNTEKPNNTSTNQPAVTTAPPPPAQKQQIQVRGERLYPSVPKEKIESLWNNCDYVDYSYVNLPLSMNRQELNDIRHTLSQISSEPALIDQNCPLLGSMLFYQKGEIALEAQIYYTDNGCNYFVFMENQKPVYANFMTKSGITFFKDIMAKFRNMQRQ